MNEIWAIVLGAGLATIGGIIGTVVTNYFHNKNEKNKEKKEAYFKILDFCNKVRFDYGLALKGTQLGDLSYIFTLEDLYVSSEVKKIFDSFMREIVKLNKGEKLDYADAELMQEKLINQIKKELKL